MGLQRVGRDLATEQQQHSHSYAPSFLTFPDVMAQMLAHKGFHHPSLLLHKIAIESFKSCCWFFLLLLSCHKAHGNLVPQPEIKHAAPTLDVWSLNHCLNHRKSPLQIFLKVAGFLRQGGRVGGLQLTSSHKHTKITTNCWTTINKKTENCPKIFYI